MSMIRTQLTQSIIIRRFGIDRAADRMTDASDNPKRANVSKMR
jgi:hypothetical protein